jgi:hypothetical protein
VESGLPVNPLPRYWRVLVREHGGESEATYEQPAGEPPPIPRVVIAVGSRRVVVDDVSTSQHHDHAHNTYTHLFDHARNAEVVKQRLEEQFGDMLM